MWSATFTIYLGAQLTCSAQSKDTNQPTITTLWKLKLLDQRDYSYAQSSPALAPDGTIYQATFSGKLMAVNPHGELKWFFQAGLEIKSSPAIADDGTIYFGSRDRKFYAVTPEGKLKWSFPTGAWVDSSPAIGVDGTIYFGSWDKNFYALNPDGTKKWVYAISNIVDSSPAIGVDGMIYFGAHDRKFYALKPDGTLFWTFPTDGQIISSPAINSNGVIYFTSTDGNLYALKPDGTKLWALHTGGVTAASPILGENGNIFLTMNQCNIGISPDGKMRSPYCGGTSVAVSPATVAGGNVYFSWPWRKLLALRNETPQWIVETTSNLTGSPVVASDGTVYFPDGRYLYAVNTTNGLPPLAKSSWPMFRANARHTGRVNLN